MSKWLNHESILWKPYYAAHGNDTIVMFRVAVLSEREFIIYHFHPSSAHLKIHKYELPTII